MPKSNLEYSEAELTRMLKATFSGMESYLRDVIMQMETEDGKIKVNALNIARLNDALQSIGQQMQVLGLDESLQRQQELLEGIAEDILGEFEDIDKESKYSQTSHEAISLLLEGADSSLTQVAGAAQEQVGTYLRAAILGGGERDSLINDIAKALEVRLNQAETLATSTLNSFARQLTVLHGQEAGVEWYAYEGPDDDVTRDWCAHWVGMRGTTDDFENSADDFGREGQPGPVMSWGGGYNCRHQFIPLAPDQLDEYEIGPSED